MLNENDIMDIYSKVYVIDANKYVPLSPCDNKWGWDRRDFPRVIALLEFKEYIGGMSFRRVLSFNGGGDPEYEYLVYDSCDNYDYPEYDLHSLSLPAKDYDFVMLNQTIEHLYDPITALRGIYNHMAEGGVFYANVPVNNVPHQTPLHFFTGVTAMGLGSMVKLAGFNIIKIGQWGNKAYFKQMFDILWSDYTYSDKPGYNDNDCPLITWIFAKK